jgi:hypothetical protein
MLTEVKRSSHAFIQSYTTAVVSRERVRGTRRPSLFATNTPHAHFYVYCFCIVLRVYSDALSRSHPVCFHLLCFPECNVCMCEFLCVHVCMWEWKLCVCVCISWNFACRVCVISLLSPLCTEEKSKSVAQRGLLLLMGCCCCCYLHTVQTQTKHVTLERGDRRK